MKIPKKEFENLVRRLTRQILLSEGYNRQKYIDEISNTIAGAFGEWIKFQICKLNNLKAPAYAAIDPGADLGRTWKQESYRMLSGELARKITKNIKGNWNKKKAINEAFEECSEAFKADLKRAPSIVAEIFEIDKRKLKVPSENSIEEYRGLVFEVVDSVLEL